MDLNQVTVPSGDVGASVDFYKRLGRVQIVESPEYARFECPDGHATFSIHQVEEVEAQPGVIVYFECDDLNATVERLERDGIRFDSQPTDQPWLWREAYVRDPGGNLLCLYHAGVNRRNPPWRMASE
jgi:catechol 2,3-dioxygenase-like lactoylglutathione lyase family enzyme